MMKKLALAALALFALAAFTNDASARSQVIKELGWSSPNSAGNYFYSKPLASETVDTSAVFSLQEADFGGPGSFSADVANTDSIFIGYLVLYSDSTADGPSTLTAVTATVEASGDGFDWAAVTTIAGIAASDDPIVVLPIILRPTIAQLNLIHAAPKLRIRYTSATGLLLACRQKVIYWKSDRDN